MYTCKVDLLFKPDEDGLIPFKIPCYGYATRRFVYVRIKGTVNGIFEKRNKYLKIGMRNLNSVEVTSFASPDLQFTMQTTMDDTEPCLTLDKRITVIADKETKTKIIEVANRLIEREKKY